jgi:hypothetical protein
VWEGNLTDARGSGQWRMSNVTKRPPIKGYTKKLNKDQLHQLKPETNHQTTVGNFMFAPPMRPSGQSHDSIILKRLEDMTRRMDLMQNNQSLTSATQLMQSQTQSSQSPSPPRSLQQQPQQQLYQPQPPSYQSQSQHMSSPRLFDLKPISFSPQRILESSSGGYGQQEEQSNHMSNFTLQDEHSSHSHPHPPSSSQSQQIQHQQQYTNTQLQQQQHVRNQQQPNHYIDHQVPSLSFLTLILSLSLSLSLSH